MIFELNYPQVLMDNYRQNSERVQIKGDKKYVESHYGEEIAAEKLFLWSA